MDYLSLMDYLGELGKLCNQIIQINSKITGFKGTSDHRKPWGENPFSPLKLLGVSALEKKRKPIH